MTTGVVFPTSSQAEGQFKPPFITIDEKALAPSLVESVFKFSFINVSMLHSSTGGITYDSWAQNNRDDVLRKLIGRELMVRDLEKLNLEVDAADLGQHIEGRIRMLGGEKAFQSLLSSVHMSLDEYRELSRQAYIASVYARRAIPESTVTDKEARAYYNANIADYTGPEERSFVYSRFRYDPSVQKEAVNILKGKSLEIKDRSDLENFTDEHKSRFGENVDILRALRARVTRSKAKAKKYKLWAPAAAISAGETTYFTLENGKYHFLLHLESVNGGEVKPFESFKVELQQKIQSLRRTEEIEKRVQELRDSVDIQINFRQ